MPIRITGLNSGLDTESIISALVSSYNYKTNKYKKAQTKLSWKQDAWKSLNTKIYSLYNSVGNMRFSNAYSMKKTTVSDNTKVSISAGTGSTNGSYSIQVTSLAKAGYLTGGRLATGTTASTKLSDLGYTGGDGKLSLTVEGKTKDITVTKDTTVQEVVNQLKEAGVNASYDATNRRFFVSSKKTGVENDFSLSGSNADGMSALTALGLNVVSNANTAEYAALAEYASMSLQDMKDIVANKLDASNQNVELRAANTNYQNAINYANAAAEIRTVGEGKNAGDFELLKALAAGTTDKYVDKDGNIYNKDKETGKYVNIDESGNKKEVLEEDIKDTANYTPAADKYEELATEFGLITDKLDEEGNPVLDKEGNAVKDKTALAAFEKNLKTVVSIDEKANAGNAELAALLAEAETAVANGTVSSYVDAKQEIIANNNETIKTNEATIAANSKLTADMTEEQIAAFKEKADYAKSVLVYDANGEVTGTNLSANADATRVNGSDATIYVNGAEYTGDSNSFSINGMTITATGITGSVYDPTEASAVSATVDTDVQGIYDKIKDFLSQYNAIINEMTSLYNADSAKGYEPLTDEEKDAMSDKEVEKWEEKIKESLLRRDDTLSSLISTMTSAMSKGVEVNGRKYYLSDFGIKTMGYLNAAKNEQNAYHIDGDEDDVNTSGNSDKLRAAITENPDTVMEFMQGLAKNLYDAVDTKMKSSSLSSVYTVYNDKEMASEYSDYTKLISKWQEKLEKQEEYYYKKFSAMETALSKLNSQTSSLTGLFG